MLSPAFKPSSPLITPPSWMDDRFLTGPSDADWHLKNTPNLSLKQYAKEKRRELSKRIFSKIKIYLDQQYWIHCRRASIGAVTDVHLDIWNALRGLVRSGRAVCPVSSISILETFKQTDLQSRRCTAEVMDELSTGIVLRSPAGRRAAEFQLLVRRLAGEVIQNEYPADQVFTWLPEAFGDITVEKRQGPPGYADAMGKAYIDAFSRARLPDLLIGMLEVSSSELFERDRAARDVHNQIAVENALMSRTHPQRLGQEVSGVLKWLKRELKPNFLELAGGSDDKANVLCDAFVELFAKKHVRGELSQEFPSLYIRAAIHAAVDHKRRRYEDGDMYDHDHAIAALPYYQLFLTEKKLGTLLTEKPAQLDKEYGCKVIWNPDEVLAELIALTSAA